MESAFGELEAALHRTPTDDELAAELEISTGELQQWLTGIASPTSVRWSTCSPPAAPRPRARSAVKAGARREDGGTRTASTGARRGAQVARTREDRAALYYGEGLTLAEIGAVLGVTESRVSQIHTKAVLVLRARLNAAGH